MTSVDELRLYSLRDTAERLLVTEDWLLKAVRAGRIPARKRGRRWAFAADDIRTAIESMAVTSESETRTGTTEDSEKGAQR